MHNEKSDSNKSGCCKSIKTDDSSQEEQSDCKEGCACCFVNTVVINDIDIPSDFNPEAFSQLNQWVAENYTHDFNHLIWHPPDPSIPNGVGGSVDVGAAEFGSIAAIPTLSQWGIMIMGLLFLIFGHSILKNRSIQQPYVYPSE